MAKFQFSSGDLIADRRYEYARAYAEAGDHAAAADLYAQTLERVPGFLPALIGVADALAEQGDRAGAETWLRRALELDREGLFGVPLKLALIGAAATPDHPPTAYVRGLFDDYAERFDKALVEDLAYRAPELIAAALEGLWPGRRYGDIMDLGCGTGLMALALGQMADRLVGCDLSGRMLAKAAETGRYQRLIEADVVAALDAEQSPFDLVVAADVFVYVGKLEAVFAACRARLKVGGVFAFTVEAAAEGEELQLRDSLRYAHGAAYIRRLAAEHGLTLVHLQQAPLRLDRGVPVIGHVVVLTG